MHAFVPDRSPLDVALARTTHLGIGAHPDDLEFMALHGILECHGRDDRHFTGITVTTGAGAPRSGRFADVGDKELAAIRRDEQDEAARVGGYSAQLQLGFSSIKSRAAREALTDQLERLLLATRPRVVYTHNPADRHPTHLAVFAATLRALRRLPAGARPERVLGCEVWRDLDWLPPDARVALDVSARPELAEELFGVFRSQIEGGKRYDLAVAGRQRANATFAESHAPDGPERVTFAMDLTPLVESPDIDPGEFVAELIDRFRLSAARELRDAS